MMSKKEMSSWSWRGGRGGATQARNLDPLASKNDWPTPKEPAVDKIDHQTLLIETEAPTIEEVEYVASYNWQNTDSPIIYVPGSPPAWTPPAQDLKLKPDHEDVFRDINAARHPNYPLEPAIRSVFAIQPDFDMQALDLVGCGSTLGNLLRFSGSTSKPFRFDVDVVGETVFFMRKEKSAREMITDLRGYGHTFPEAYTTWDAEVRKSCSHQRLIQYSFGDLRLLVRSETDGYVKEKPGVKPRLGTSEPTSVVSVEEMEARVKEMSMDKSSGSAGNALQLEFAGARVSQDQIFDIKTRSSRNILDMSEIYPRLWVNQTSKFLLAYNTFGVFDDPQIKDVRQDVFNWQKDKAALLARYHGLIQRIIQVARNSPDQQLEVRWDGQGPLCIYKQAGKGRRVLPESLLNSVG